jgi:hypothetical protein
VLSVVTVADRIYFTWRELNGSKKVEDELLRLIAKVS